MSIALSHSPANVSRWLLVQMGILADPTIVDANDQPTGAWPGYDSNEPNIPENCVTFKDTLGHEFGRTQLDGEMLYHPGIQVRIRASDQLTGWKKADQIRKAMAEQVYATKLTVLGSVYLVYNFNNISQALPLGRDTPTSKRSLFTINACVVIRQLS